MSRRPLALALVLALLPVAAQADDLLQSYTNARNSDPQYAAAESNRAIAAERPVQARAVLLPQVNGSVGYDLANRGDTDGDGQSDGTSRSASWGLSAQQSIFDYGNYTALRAAKALDRAGGFDLDAAGHSLITRTSAAYFNVLVQLETLSAAEAAESALKKQFDFASKRLEVGLAPITDVHEARAQYDGARANTILARNAVQDAYQALVEITGTLVPGWAGGVIASTCLLQFLLSLAMDSRYDVRLHRYLGTLIWYPMVFWLITMTTTVWAVPPYPMRAIACIMRVMRFPS